MDVQDAYTLELFHREQPAWNIFKSERERILIQQVEKQTWLQSCKTDDPLSLCSSDSDTEEDIPNAAAEPKFVLSPHFKCVSHMDNNYAEVV